MEANADIWYSKFDKNIVDKNIAFFKEYLVYRYELLNEEWK